MPKKKRDANIKSFFWISSTFFRSTSESVVSPFLPLYGLHLGANQTQIGLIVAIASLFNVFQLIWARIADKIKDSRLIAIISLYVGSAFNIIYIFVTNIGAFITLRGSHGAITSASIPTSSALLAERTKYQDWGYWNGVINGAIVGGALVGLLLGGYLLSSLADNIKFTVLFLGAAVISLLAAIFFNIAVPSQRRLIAKQKWIDIEEVSVTIENVLNIMKTDRNFVILNIAYFIFIFGVNFSSPFYIIYTVQYYSLSVFEVSIIAVIGFAPQLIASLIAPKFFSKARKKELLVLGGLGTSIYPIIFILPGLLVYYNNLFLFMCILWGINGLFWGVINTTMSTLILDVIHPRRRTIQLAIINSVASVGLFLSPVIGGLTVELSQIFILMFIISAGIRFIGALLFLIVKEPVIGGSLLRPIRRVASPPRLYRRSEDKKIQQIQEEYQADESVTQSTAEISEENVDQKVT